MLPGKKYTPEDFLRIAWRRKWFIIVPTVVLSTLATAYAQMLPNRYTSSAMVLIIGQQVPTNLVRSTVTDTVADRLRIISQQILSRTKLERIIEEFDLYREERRTGLMEDIVGRMRTRDLGIDIPGSNRKGVEPTSFTVSFTAENPRTAMRVAERLAALFVQENTNSREIAAGSTSQFLETELEAARRRLQQQDEKIAAFRTQHAGRLPTQMQSNLQMMQTVQAQIQTNAEAARTEQDRLAALETMAAEMPVAAGPAGPTGAVAGDGPVAARLEQARTALRALQLRLTDEHPEVRAAKRAIAELEAMAEEEVLARPLSADAIPAALRGSDAQRVANLRFQMQELRASIARRQQEDARLKARLASYSTRLESSPGVETELTDLMRDYGTQREQYETLLKKRDDSRLAESLERRQIGEQFRVIDTARLPERPVSPDRPRLYLFGLLSGLGLGVALIGLLEYRDTTFKTDTDIIVSLALPVLAVIPAMSNAVDRAHQRRRFRVAVLAASTASVLLVAAVAVVWKFGLIDSWIR